MLHALLAALLLLAPAAGSARRRSSGAEPAQPWCLQMRQADAQGWGRYAEKGTAEREAHAAAAAADMRLLWRRALPTIVQTVLTVLPSSGDAATRHGGTRPPAAPRVMRRHFVTGTDPLAICNDGSSGVRMIVSWMSVFAPCHSSLRSSVPSAGQSN